MNMTDKMSTSELKEFLLHEISLAVYRQQKSCLNCSHFEDATQLCTLAALIPPPKIAVVGCEKYEQRIPF
jgi:hypothetical protein